MTSMSAISEDPRVVDKEETLKYVAEEFKALDISSLSEPYDLLRI